MLKLSLDKLSQTLINALLTKKRQLEALNINELDEKHVRACLRNLSLLPDQLFFFSEFHKSIFQQNSIPSALK